MIKIRKAGERGKTQTSWLDSNHTFSFNRHYDPEWSGFGDLLVINEVSLLKTRFGQQDRECLRFNSSHGAVLSG